MNYVDATKGCTYWEQGVKIFLPTYWLFNCDKNTINFVKITKRALRGKIKLPMRIVFESINYDLLLIELNIQ